MSRDCIIRLEDVWTCYGPRVVHRDISLCLWRGEILGLVGGSGSGKTTLLREMLDLQRPTRGRITIFDKDLALVDAEQRQELRRRTGVLFQGGALFSALTVFDNIAVPLRELKRLDEESVRCLVTLQLSMVGLEPEAADLLPSELSGGMVKRAGLARALALQPELLLLDEPTSGLDPASSDAFVRLVRRLHRELHLSMVLITHDFDTLIQLCDRIGVLADARLVAIGKLDEVRRAEHPFVQRLFHGVRGQRLVDLEAQREGL
jgi:phospholipid/cholesterol/gamma-HCH transport system ATP-binding protein